MANIVFSPLNCTCQENGKMQSRNPNRAVAVCQAESSRVGAGEEPLNAALLSSHEDGQNAAAQV